MDDLDRRFTTDSDRSADHRELEIEESAEPALDAEPKADAPPCMSSDGPDQAPDAKTSTPQVKKGPPTREVIARMKAASIYGNPLAILAHKEADLHAHSAAKLSTFDERRPDPDLLVHQLVRAAGTRFGNSHKGTKLTGDAVALYSALQSRDPMESILHRLIVGLSNTAMDCLSRAQTGNPRARELELRYANKSAATIGDLMKLRDTRRGQGGSNVTVGKVKVESGGQAIVGNVNAGKERTQAPRPEATPRSRTTETKN